MSLSDDRLRQIAHRFGELEARLASGTLEGDAFVAASRDYAELEPVARVAAEVAAMRGELADLQSMEDSDPEMRALAAEEVARLKEELPERERQLAIAMLPRDSADQRPAMLEIRAGTGGDEAALFAADLYRMYEKYAAEQGWRVEMVSANASDVGGFKEVVANVTGTGVFAKLKFESGVHRVQRVPVTESGGRIHTSAATVAVLPEPTEVDVQIEDKDLKIDIYRASGAGGQHVNTTDSAVRITHLPTDIVVTCQDERSQHKNKAKAMQVLRARLYEKMRDEAQGAEAEARKAMVGSGDRSERIRTYNFPQGRVTDHRINLTLHRLPEVLEGTGLGELIDALIAEDEAKRLAAMDG
ncbi:peptide chain release factor 1 [Novosphingobium mangrovi (ex Hu et al. 2023)]|uniref:Peptide chain release factor 1 n=1 Tax=Novosphingobium mangrovi (ex Hu et al. 2023) TaxID=2930094 RepID=A0ABT0ADQ6_9SPHN|nr:peptide chain release factor 1 [Novosphingobium mangrovi (ex Hu et al. 2023)]MCJ1961336.1 peptide chain release factor 1 [Novosphingobium mangrovi (ex Hu et al. 2023)]